MEFKPQSEKRIPIDVHEWNDSIEAYLRPPRLVDRVIFWDNIATYYDKSLSADERSEAGFLIVIAALVDESGEPLLTTEDIPKLKEAPFEPITRTINALLNLADARGESAETVKNS